MIFLEYLPALKPQHTEILNVRLPQWWSSAFHGSSSCAWRFTSNDVANLFPTIPDPWPELHQGWTRKDIFSSLWVLYTIRFPIIPLAAKRSPARSFLTEANTAPVWNCLWNQISDYEKLNEADITWCTPLISYLKRFGLDSRELPLLDRASYFDLSEVQQLLMIDPVHHLGKSTVLRNKRRQLTRITHPQQPKAIKINPKNESWRSPHLFFKICWDSVDLKSN